MKVTATLTAPLKTVIAGGSAPEIATDATGSSDAVLGPTDVLAAALASCTASMISYTATQRKLEIGAVSVSVDKTMSMSPHRIGSFTVIVTGDKPLDARARALLEAAARSCPVKNSLNPEIPVSLVFNWN